MKTFKLNLLEFSDLSEDKKLEIAVKLFKENFDNEISKRDYPDLLDYLDQINLENKNDKHKYDSYILYINNSLKQLEGNCTDLFSDIGEKVPKDIYKDLEQINIEDYFTFDNGKGVKLILNLYKS